jgi:DNA-binding response OmpR family regulator
MPQTILLVDDDPTLRDVLELYLRREGFTVETVGDGQAALEKAPALWPDLIVLDLMLPKVDGWEVCRRLRAASPVPIVMLTARGEEYERILGLGLGADDYITKPFSPGEVVARIKAIFRRIELARATAPPPERSLVRAGPLLIDPVAREALLEGRALTLTAKEFDLLHFLASHPREVFSQAQLLDRVWGYAYAGETGTVAVHIRHLREKIEPTPGRPRYLETVWGVGYRFNDQAESN